MAVGITITTAYFERETHVPHAPVNPRRLLEILSRFTPFKGLDIIRRGNFSRREDAYIMHTFSASVIEIWWLVLGNSAEGALIKQ